MKPSQQPLSPEDMQAIAKALTEVSEKLNNAMQQIVEKMVEVSQKPEFQAMLAALPEPDPEHLKTYVCMDYNPETCRHRCEITTILKDGEELLHCPVGGFAGSVIWQNINEVPDKEEDGQ